ncbi:hypothetical protein [Cellvibrio sp. pealriver]|uniref:hypothetical protein n=1 Tax=Cellvibrio sp. pealriver TaxID=1622269 RepID=UPI0012E19836|nr:hypothetical protein [Cellvibrio sp. pealriver]
MKTVITGTLLLCSQISVADVIFSDDFESGKASSLWTDLTSVAVVPLPSATGRAGSAMRFTYKGNADDTQDAFAEARFDLKAEYKKLSIKYDLFVPENYIHQKPSDRIDNNKFFRLWREKYTVGDHIGASMLSEPDGDSLLGVDYKLEPTWGISTGIDPKGNFISAADRGKWLAIRIEVEAPVSATQLGAIRIYKNDKLFVGTNKVTDVEPGEQGWRYGYLLGWANSGFRADTFLYIDNVQIEDSVSQKPKPPENTLVR